MRSFCFLAVLPLFGFVGEAPAAAPQFPTKPIRYIVATGAGGASDRTWSIGDALANFSGSSAR